MADLLRTTLRVLTFRADGEELTHLGPRHLAFGLFCTWVAGIGRWWDDPGAHPLLHLGLGSVVYIFVLATFLYLIIWPLRPRFWTWRNVVTYVSLTAPPAFLYAIPVERWTDLNTALSANFWCLAVVSAWRVALLFRYLAVATGLSVNARCVGALLPLGLIINALAFLNLERGALMLMAGVPGEPPPGQYDAAYAILAALTVLSWFGSGPLIIWYLIEMAVAWDTGKHFRKRAEVPSLEVRNTRAEGINSSDQVPDEAESSVTGIAD